VIDLEQIGAQSCAKFKSLISAISTLETRREMSVHTDSPYSSSNVLCDSIPRIEKCQKIPSFKKGIHITEEICLSEEIYF